MVTTQPEYFLTSTVHTTSSPKGGPLTTESAVTKSMSIECYYATKSMSTTFITGMCSLTSGKNVSHNLNLQLRRVA